MTYIEQLKELIGRLYSCDSIHVATVPITESCQGKIIWKGNVEVFEIHGHPRARRCYAWSYQDAHEVNQYTTLLELPPVHDAQTAVKAAIAPK